MDKLHVESNCQGNSVLHWCSDIVHGNSTLCQWISNVILKITLNYVYSSVKLVSFQTQYCCKYLIGGLSAYCMYHISFRCCWQWVWLKWLEQRGWTMGCYRHFKGSKEANIFLECLQAFALCHSHQRLCCFLLRMSALIRQGMASLCREACAEFETVRPVLEKLDIFHVLGKPFLS